MINDDTIPHDDDARFRELVRRVKDSGAIIAEADDMGVGFAKLARWRADPTREDELKWAVEVAYARVARANLIYARDGAAEPILQSGKEVGQRVRRADLLSALTLAASRGDLEQLQRGRVRPTTKQLKREIERLAGDSHG